VVLSGSGRSQDFKNKEGNVKVNNMCLVYLKSYSVNVLPSISGQCRSGVGGSGGGGKGIGEYSSRQEKNWK
jgi:hypothetical protein